MSKTCNERKMQDADNCMGQFPSSDSVDACCKKYFGDDTHCSTYCENITLGDGAASF